MKKILFAALLFITSAAFSQTKKVSELALYSGSTPSVLDSSEVVANVAGVTYRVKGFKFSLNKAKDNEVWKLDGTNQGSGTKLNFSGSIEINSGVYNGIYVNGQAVSVGLFAVPGSTNGTAIGYHAQADYAAYQTSIGANTVNYGVQGTVLGSGSIVQGRNGLALGYIAQSNNLNSVALGSYAISNDIAQLFVTDSITKMHLKLDSIAGESVNMVGIDASGNWWKYKLPAPSKIGATYPMKLTVVGDSTIISVDRKFISATVNAPDDDFTVLPGMAYILPDATGAHTITFPASPEDQDAITIYCPLISVNNWNTDITFKSQSGVDTSAIPDLATVEFHYDLANTVWRGIIHL